MHTTWILYQTKRGLCGVCVCKMACYEITICIGPVELANRHHANFILNTSSIYVQLTNKLLCVLTKGYRVGTYYLKLFLVA